MTATSSSRRARRRARPGASTQRHATRLGLQGFALSAAALALAGLAASSPTETPRAIGLALAGAVALAGAARVQSARRWALGAQGERQVARRLRRLPAPEWLVVHDIDKRWGGNLDHLVAGPRGVFTIETKLARYGPRDLQQARAHVAWAQRTLGVSATAVLCIARSRQRPRQLAGVWCIGAPRLTRFLRRHPGAGPVDVPQLARRLQGLRDS